MHHHGDLFFTTLEIHFQLYTNQNHQKLIP
jgi:hypothetical protein